MNDIIIISVITGHYALYLIALSFRRFITLDIILSYAFLFIFKKLDQS